MNQEERFWSKVDRKTPQQCWPWLASKREFGYGQFRLGETMALAHRVAYELLIGQIPDGLELDHLCRNPSCVNPAHLEPVTHRENCLRGTGSSARNARKAHCPRGHYYGGDNLYIHPDGGRRCRNCTNALRREKRSQNANR